MGGLIGKNAGLVARTYATGTVSATSSVTAASSDNVGGLAGRNGGTVRAVYATGAVSGNASVGGLIGSNTEKVQYAFSTGSVTGQSAVSSGGLIGANAATESTITDSYWDTTTGPATSAAGTGNHHRVADAHQQYRHLRLLAKRPGARRVGLRNQQPVPGPESRPEQRQR